MAILNAEDERTLRNIFLQLCVQSASVLESETLEFKSWCCNEKQLAEKASDSAACLANAHGGLLVLGIDDKNQGSQKFLPCPYRDATPEWVAQRIQDGTVPPVEVRVVDACSLLQETTGHLNAHCFAVFVTKTRRAGGHQTTSGLSRIRSGKNCRPYYLAEDDRTKAQVESANLADLSLSSITWGIQQHKRKFDLHGETWESPGDFLSHIGLIESSASRAAIATPSRISLAAMLLFGTESAIRRICPGLETIVISRLGENRIRTNIVDSYRFLLGPRTGLLNSLCPQIPERCIKEVLMNSYVHRDYRINSPVIIRATDDAIAFESPGGLCTGLSSESLLHCTPVYRNFLLAEGSRYLGLCDKVGRGIDTVYQSVLEQGLGFPVFEDGDNHFMTRISLAGNPEFQEFVKCRAQSLSLLDEIIVLRFLFDRESASFRELCAAMQRGHSFGHGILSDMVRKSMIEADSSLNLNWRLSPIVRADIENIFKNNQYDLDFRDLFAEQKLQS
jgi:ATP-dependent DNA helicase RecG